MFFDKKNKAFENINQMKSLQWRENINQTWIWTIPAMNLTYEMYGLYIHFLTAEVEG